MTTEVAFLEDGSVKIPTAHELEEADKGARIICLLAGQTDDGGDGWAFIAIKPSLYKIFYKTCKTGEELVPETFGEIIAHGKGLPPPSDVVKRMQSRYGFDPHFSERLVEDAKKQQKALFVHKESLRVRSVVATLKSKNKRSNKDENF